MRDRPPDQGGDETAETLRKLRDLVPDPAEAHGLVMLLGNGVAQALTGLRARQASLELARASARGAPSVELRRAEAEAAREAATAVQEEVRRLRVTEPYTDEQTVGVYGHVLDAGEPVVGAQVGLVAGDRVLACVDTDNAGAFALSQESDRALALRVRVGEKVVHIDEAATLWPGPVATYRRIDLGAASVPAPEQYDCEGERPRPSQPLPEPGGSLVQTLKGLRAAGAPLSRVRLARSKDATPQVVDVQDRDRGVELEVRGRTTDAGRLAVVAVVLAHQPEAVRAGVGSAAAASALLKIGRVTTWDEAQNVATLHPAELADRFGLDRDQGSALSTALAATMSMIEIVGEG